MSAMKKKARVDEIEKILNRIDPFTADNYINDKWSRIWLRRKLRALVREVWNLRTRKTAYWAAIELKERFGTKP